MLPLRGGNLEGAAVVVLELQTLGRGVVDFALMRSLAVCRFLQLVWQEEAADQAQGRQVEGGMLLAQALHGLSGSST